MAFVLSWGYEDNNFNKDEAQDQVYYRPGIEAQTT